MHDARVFAHSPLYTNITEKELLPNKIYIIKNGFTSFFGEKNKFYLF